VLTPPQDSTDNEVTTIDNEARDLNVAADNRRTEFLRQSLRNASPTTAPSRWSRRRRSYSPGAGLDKQRCNYGKGDITMTTTRGAAHPAVAAAYHRPVRVRHRRTPHGRRRHPRTRGGAFLLEGPVDKWPGQQQHGSEIRRHHTNRATYVDLQPRPGETPPRILITKGIAHSRRNAPGSEYSATGGA
jgi:hypothetical protein